MSLSILVLLHEMGHFIPAKLFKTRVEKFYLFFDAWFSLFKFKKGDTEYGIGWLPLGGYVKIAGMIDESMDKEQMKKDPEPWEFRSKPAWQRLIIMIGGVVVNILLACFIYSITLMTWGEKKLPLDQIKYGVQCMDSLAFDLGFRNGDRIVRIGEKELSYFGEVMPALLLEDAHKIEVVRDGQIVDLDFGTQGIARIIQNGSALFFPRVPIVVKDVQEGYPASTAGLLPNDRLLRIGSDTLLFFDQLSQVADKYADSTTTLLLDRKGEKIEVAITPNTEGRLGFLRKGINWTELEEMGVIATENKLFGFWESIPAGVRKAGDKLNSYIRQFKLIFNSETGAYKEVGGFGAMAKMFSPTWDWLRFWEMTAFLSIMLAFMNILPIPALDGGHVLFLLYEITTGRKPNEKFLEYAQMAGMILLFGLLIFANGNDILKIFQ